jgi:hypothetical protein
MDTYIKTIKIDFSLEKEVTIKPNEKMLDLSGHPIEIVKENGDTDFLLNNKETDIIKKILKSDSDFSEEELEIMDNHFMDLQKKVDDYKDKLELYNEDGGEKPVAEQDIMDIVELHDCNFVIKFIKA